MIKENYNVRDLKKFQDQLNKMDPVDIKDLFDDISNENLAIIIKLLNKNLLADTFAVLSKGKKIELINALSDSKIIEIMNDLDEDELVDTLQEIPANMVNKFMKYIKEESRPIVNRLLGYPEQSVGAIMSVNFIAEKINKSVEEIIGTIKNSKLEANKLEQIWITDDKLKLQGYVYVADLLRSEDSDIKNILKPINKTVMANDDQELAAKIALKYDLSDIPVVDSEFRLIGSLPSEWLIEVISDEYKEDMSNISGINEGDKASYTNTSVFNMAKNRSAWLIVCLITATMTGFIIKRYEDILSASVALTAYIPMLMDGGGNAGSQASTTSICSLYDGELSYRDILKVLFKEAKIGFLVGLAMGIINFLRIIFMDNISITINLVVSVTLLITIIISNMLGGILPLIADKLKVDPTVMAGPIITTMVDTVALLVYFEIASKLLKI